MADTLFASLVQLGKELEATKKRSELTALLADFLQTLTPDAIPAAVRLTIGQIFAEWDGRSLNVSWKALLAIVEGEAVAVDTRGRPLPFQHLMRRFRRRRDIEATIAEVPVQLYLFDALYVDGRSLVDAGYEERWAALAKAAGDLDLVPHLLPQDIAEAEAFAQAAHREGHEGLVAKEPHPRRQVGCQSRHTPDPAGIVRRTVSLQRPAGELRPTPSLADDIP